MDIKFLVPLLSLKIWTPQLLGFPSPPCCPLPIWTLLLIQHVSTNSCIVDGLPPEHLSILPMKTHKLHRIINARFLQISIRRFSWWPYSPYTTLNKSKKTKKNKNLKNKIKKKLKMCVASWWICLDIKISIPTRTLPNSRRAKVTPSPGSDHQSVCMSQLGHPSWQTCIIS